MNWLYYIAEANLYLGVFYLAYCLFLQNETYYQLNRAYLIGSCIVSFILPVLQIGAIKPTEVTEALSYYSYQPVELAAQLPETANAAPLVNQHQLTTNDYLWYGYFVGAAILLVLLIIKLLALYKLVRKEGHVQHSGYKLIQLPQSDAAFSFFNYLFIGKNADGANTIIRHELVHIRQKHSVDIVFLEILKIVNWFNPFIYLIQNSLKTVHEYIADEQTAAHETDPIIYSTFLLNNAYGTGGSTVTHSFFNYNLLKRRIIMLNQKRSGHLAKLRYLVAVPVCAASLCASTLAFSKDYGWIDIAPAEPLARQDLPKLPTLAHLDNNGGVVVNISKHNTVVGFNSPVEKQALPLLIANSKRYHLNKIKYDFSVVISADSTTQYNAGNAYAIETWGEDAKNGVLVLHGESAAVRIEKGTLPETAHINFPQEKTDKYPPPSVFKKGFGRLMGHLQHNVPYTDELRNEKNTYVGVSFNVGADRKISNIQIFKPANNGYDAVAKAAFESFDGVVTAAPGKHTFMLNYYSEKGPFDPEYLKSKYDVNLVIVKPKPGEVKVSFPPPTPPKKVKQTGARVPDKNNGYVTAGRLNNGAVPIQTIAPKGTTALFIVDGKKYEFTPETLAKYNAKSLIYMSCDKMTVYEQGNAYAEKTWGKYGKVAVLSGNASIRIVELPFGKENAKVNVDTDKETPATANNITQDDIREFGKYLGNYIHYPQIDRKDTVGGRVITVFAVNADGTLQYAKVVRTPSAAMADEIIRVLKKCPQLSMFKPGVQYTVPVTFTLGYDNSDGDKLDLKFRRNGNVTAYNPNAVDININQPGLMLADIVIRGYIKKS